MKRCLAKNLSMYEGLNLNIVDESISDSKCDLSQDPLGAILSDIFSVDENSGLPKGDIAYYLSPDGNPSVKSWLENNLLRPRAKSVGSSVEGVTDDIINEFSRSKKESIEDYQARLTSLFESAKAEYDSFINQNK